MRITLRWQNLTRTYYQKEIDKAESLPEQIMIVNDVKKGTVRLPFALLPDATLAHLIDLLIFQLTHYRGGVGAAEAEAVRHNGGQFAIGRFGHDVQTRSLLVQLLRC